MTKTPARRPQAARRQRRRGDLPAGFRWRDGRPRWEPSPTRRAQGWKGCDLKDAWKQWLAKGPAIARAETIAGVVAAWSSGAAVPGGFVAIAPDGAELAGAAPGDLSPRSIGALLDAYRGERRPVPGRPGHAAWGRGCDRFERLADKTKADYRNKLDRFLAVAAGLPRPAKTVAALRGIDIDLLIPPQFGEPGVAVIEEAYDALRAQAGETMAYGVIACVSAWLTWCVKKKRALAANPCALIERSAPDGRIEVYEWDELVALVRMAEAAGSASIGDALVLAVDLSWSEQDLLDLDETQVSDDLHVKHRRIKTGVAGNPPLLALGRQRLAEIRARRPAAKVAALRQRIIVCETTGRPWKAAAFQHRFAQIRAVVAQGIAFVTPAMPSVARLQFRDTRDTAVTFAYEAGLSDKEICTRTLHDPKRCAEILHKHYGASRQGLADAAAVRLNAHYAAQGYTFEALLALPAPVGG